MEQPKVTVITATTGNPILARNIKSVAEQTHRNIQHLVVVDGPDHYEKVNTIFGKTINDVEKYKHLDLVKLPYSIGKDRWNGHRIYAAGTYMAEGQYVMYLDDDNTIAPNHIEECLKVITQGGNDWAYSFRNIVDKEGKFLYEDNCENLGKWPSVLNDQDYFIDVNCYFLPILLAVQIDRKSTRLNSSHTDISRMPSSA